MATRKIAPQVLHGISVADEATLREALVILDDLIAHAALLGAGEAQRARELAARVRHKVAPEDTAQLIQEANAFNAIFGDVVTRNRQRTEQAEAARQAERDEAAALLVTVRQAKDAEREKRRAMTN